MKQLSLSRAQEQYPHAWSAIESDIQDAREGYDAELVPESAEVVVENGNNVLRVVAVSDISVVEEDQDSFARFAFSAVLAPF
jgi:hypothetical protein